MQVIWNPEDSSGEQVWAFDPDDVLRSDGELIENHYGGTWDQWMNELRTGGLVARSVLLWYMLHLVHPRMQYKDVPDFRVRQLKVHMSVGELKDLYERAQKMKMTAQTREQFDAAMELQLREAMDREGMEGEVTIVEGHVAIEGGSIDDPKHEA